MNSLSKSRTKTIDVFTLLLIAANLSAMAAWYFDDTEFRIVSYLSELLLILYAFLNSRNTGKNGINLPIVLLVAAILIVNYIVSPNEPQHTNLLKYFGYFCCFYYGGTLAIGYDSLKVNKFYIFGLIFLPVLIVALFDDTALKNLFFMTSNTFVYTGLSMALFYALVNYKKRHFMMVSWLIVAFYILICTSLGVVVAILLSYLILNFRVSYIPYFCIGGGFIVLAVFFIDIPLFLRIRDVMNLWMSMSTSDLANLQDINYYELNQRVDIAGERGDVGSSVWRISQWTNLFMEYVKNIWTIPFGMGAGFSVSYTGLLPHNDYLRILVEYGLVAFCCFIKFIRTIYWQMKGERMLIYFILAMFIYHLTENLMLTFPPNAVFYFVLGWCSIKFRNKSIRMKYEGVVNQ